MANSIQNSVKGAEGTALKKSATLTLLFEPRSEIQLYCCLAYYSKATI